MKDFEFRKNNFDLIRFLAALQVAFVHGYEHFGVGHDSLIVSVLSIFPGVPIFFVVSGFLISASLEKSGSISSYFQNRFLRIYPALWGCFAISLMTMFVFYDPKFTSFEFSTWVVAQLSIGQFYNPDFLRGYGVGVLNGSLWTIPVELQFYIILPVIYMFLSKIKRNNFAILSLILVFSIISYVYVGFLSGEKGLLVKLFGVTVIPYLYMFLFGVVLQRNIWFVSRFLENKIVVISLVYLFSVFLSHYAGFRYQGNYLHPLPSLMLAFLTISFAYSYVGRMGDVLKGNDISYGIYIYHMVFVNSLLQISIFSPGTNQIVMLMLTIVAAFCSWRLIERPALSLKRHSIKRRKDN